MDGQATVSVIIPVWNVEPYLRECLDSVAGQTIGLDRLEVIAVDDGSTDGSGALLDEYAARYPQIAVIHEPNSGGPGGPRNVGLDHATGTFVFFLDADDYLGREALEWLVAMAERNASDVVLGRMVGIGGRPVPTRAFSRSLDRARLDQVYSTLTVLKLFRRALIERVGLRFQDGLAGGEDAPFTIRAYLEAGVISVVADYDCYYCRLRPGSQSRNGRRDDLVAHEARMAQRIELLAQHTKPGIGRDRLMARHIADVVRPFRRHWLVREPEERRQVFDAASVLIRRWHTRAIQRSLPPWHAIRAWCLQHGLVSELEDIAACSNRTAFGDPVVEGRRVFARYPHFRDASGIPDSCFEITSRVVLHQHVTRAAVADGALHLSGEAYLSLLGGSTTIVLRRWPRGPEYRFGTDTLPTPYLRDRQVTHSKAGFAVAVDLATAADGRPLPPGSWDIFLSVGTRRVQRTARFRPPKGPGHATSAMPGRPMEPDLPAALATVAGYLRLRMGAVSRTTRWLERGEAAYRRIRRSVSAGLNRLSPAESVGRLLPGRGVASEQ